MLAVCAQELQRVARQSAPGLSDEEVERIYRALDTDNTGTVEVDEFFAGMLPMVASAKRELIAHQSFKAMDK